ncbi:MAG: hypothetical protein A3C30_01800 [Candidatus Levybacteria bacterium RIFCSPHIGHO2_02_FULL_40_18]|nr:MAG: hypothetical protein A2869_00670 [Candidatus Levybacteria bacterium RIFCSPHIGHO2_01_FULL_40_58]OGH26725.1 MAG: hypothetical protein A3C30_01800 [Candidatus Levybacteria bacterium RIFCSPHIGHO2_02_FULL_40_18]OGH31660.1 MAG: hypothetical protein A3E43_01520 [Candidatus Levybacteria bacterium RIFCSPHIGHO2_12_FULL_40_31]OGH40560.1 MAG: hypothetical protein A2894_00070 [Candidatus Levybacteria bacterium RIFCSPLOWO2_01_FULL_40_64]OGH48736.1 MAG: hypothetical protein A3I54_03695 [Candidatus Lev
MNPVIFAILAAASFGLWTVFHKLASPYINQIFGAILVSLTAVIFGGIIFLFNMKGVQLFSDIRGIIFVVLAGIAAFFIDYLALQAYSKGLSLTIGGPIIIGGSMAVAVLIGLLLGEPLTAIKILGIILIVIGGIVLASIG